MPRRLSTGVAALGASATLVLGALPAPAEAVPPAAPNRAAKPYDVDGNGHPDLVVGARGLRVRGAADVGGVVVLPASTKGLSSAAVVVPNPDVRVWTERPGRLRR